MTWSTIEVTLLAFMVVGWAFSWLRARARYDGLKNVLEDHKSALERLNRRLDDHYEAIQRVQRDHDELLDRLDEALRSPPSEQEPPVTSPQKRQPGASESSKDFWDRLDTEG